MLKESLRFRNSSTNRFPVSVTRTQTHTQGFLSLACNYGWRRVETGRKSNLNFLTESGPPQRHSMASYLFVSHPHALPVSYRWCDVAPHTGWCAGVLASLSISCCGHSSFLLHLRHKMRVSNKDYFLIMENNSSTVKKHKGGNMEMSTIGSLQVLGKVSVITTCLN